MTAPVLVVLAWALFACTHLLLGIPLRAPLVRRMGEPAFVAVFSAVAALSMGVLATVVARVGGHGPTGLALGTVSEARYALGVVAFLGLALACAGLLNYPQSATTLFRSSIRSPRGIERVTRHAFFVGLAVFAAAHALLAPTLAVALYFTGYALFAAAGALIQDRKLVAKWGAPYAEFVSATSLVPFAALLDGRQKLVAGEGLARTCASSAAIAALCFAGHSWLSAWHGAPLAALIAIGGVFVTARRWHHARRVHAAAPQEVRA